MKNSWEWTESDILELINNEIPESLNLDYKRIDSLGKSDGKKNEISKDVSSFANSAGGILIYGVVEDGNVPTSIDGGVDPNVISKEWIEHVINSRIQRRISGIRINQIKLSPPSTNVIYVLDIPQSNLAPHMAGDRRFYKRFNFESVPMEEYEVRDVGNRNITPDLKFDVQLINKGNNSSNQFACNFLLFNESIVPAEYTSLEFHIDLGLKFALQGQLSDGGESGILVDNENIKTQRYYTFLTIPGSMPILHGINFNVVNGPVKFYYPKSKGRYYILARITTAKVEPKDFLFHFDFDGEKVEISKR
ncbi:AlbA family DNA-binding domain-containing protein [Priestia megaterium]|uniref:AlbA family DNA-binding domain-containing protein n=1 Tax=Priestia megaterium TaxID=1404 RepID=UPI003D95514F